MTLCCSDSGSGREQKGTGRVAFVGVGWGEPDLLTVW